MTLRNDVCDSGSLPTSSNPLDPSPPASPTAITGTNGFKKYVLAYLNNESELFLHLYLRRSEGVPLFRFLGTVFTIQTTSYLLQQLV